MVLGHPLGRRRDRGTSTLPLGAGPGHAAADDTFHPADDDAAAVPVAELGRLPEGVPVRVPVEAARLDAWERHDREALGAVWLVRRGDAVSAIAAACPHAGCAVDWDVTARHFRCPCHTSAFGIDGQRLHGPSPRDLDTLVVEVRRAKGANPAARVYVRFRRFRLGVAGKEPIG